MAADDHSIVSDESSFYGDDEEVSRLEELAATYDPEPYWSTIHPNLLSTIQYNQTVASRRVNSESEPVKPESQLSSSSTAIKSELDPSSTSHSEPKAEESISNFLSRLPPSTTPVHEVGPWLIVHAPNKHPHTQQDVASLVSKGTKLLHTYEDKKTDLEAQHDRSGAKTRAPLTRKLNPLRQSLERDIFALARETGVISGKWMMFLTSDRVDEYWAAVAEATAKGELGIAAKVATDEGKDSARLLAVYTRDYADRDDVKRVVKKLVDLGLVKEDERPIYYKCDAYTYLQIMGNNPYGLKASLFSSRDALGGKI
ncbi:hypothetical protein BDV59DRAFT_168460 [Aspergillus ambiguus]|uniref:DUF1917 domain-containing protein n=1 Tax=Aspergillus ambiguus TaxID=176160 RepID=UPI003CCD366E